MKTTAVKHVLLIEPDPVQAETMYRYLSSKAIKIQVAPSAQSAIAAADKQLPDAVVLELALPTHNGIEFLHEFRSYQEWADVPVLIFSQQYIDIKTSFATLGYIKHLYKPQTSLAELKAQLFGLLA